MFRQKGVKKLTFEEEYDPIDIEDYLAHYGRKGMKWYEHIFGRLQEHAKYNKSKKNEYKRLSDDELRTRINRLKLEREYKNLSSNNIGKKVALSVLGAIGAASLGTVRRGTMEAEVKIGKKVVKRVLSKIKR